MLWRVFERHRVRACLLSGSRNPLQQSCDDEEDRSENADMVVSRQTPDEEGGKAHQQQGEGQNLLAAELVTDVTENNRAERTRDIGNAEGRERRHGGGLRIRR